MFDLRHMLMELRSQYGLIALTSGTEWEDMDYMEIEYLYSLGAKELPILVKVSGPEAKTDLRHLRAMGVTGIFGPMIESEYALEKFVATVVQTYDDGPIDPIIAIYLETIDGYHKLDDIIKNPAFESVSLIIVGRLDLSLSMHIEDVDHPDVLIVVQDLVGKLRKAGKHVAVGGFVNPSSINVLQRIDIDRISTGHLLFDLGRVKNASVSVRKAIEFEIAYYESLMQINPKREIFYQSRVDLGLGKLDKAEVLNSVMADRV